MQEWILTHESVRNQVELLDAAVVSVNDKKIANAIETDGMGTVQLIGGRAPTSTPDDATKAIRSRSKDAMIFGIGNEQISVAIHYHCSRIVQRPRAGRSSHRHSSCQSLIGRKQLDAIVIRIGHVQVKVGVDENAHWRVQLIRSGS